MTLEPDVADAVKALMREREIGFKEALNRLVRQGARPRSARQFKTSTFELGRPAVDLDKALALAAALEDEEMLAKVTTGR